MKKIIACLALLLMISCKKEEHNCFEPKPIIPVLVAKGESFPGRFYSSYPNRVCNSESEWDYFIRESFSYSQKPSWAKEIDFDKFKVIATIDEQRTTGGYFIDIVSVIEHKDNIIIRILRTSGGFGIHTFSQPYHIVKIPKSSKPIVFEQMF